MRLLRKLTAPLTVVVLILVAAMAFNMHLHPSSENPPPILDPEFSLWVPDASVGGNRPLVWHLTYVRGTGDQIRLQRTALSGRNALEIQVFEDGMDQELVYIYLWQMIDGARLNALFNMEVSVSIFLNLSCACRQPPASQSAVFGIRTNDGLHALDFIFSNRTSQPQVQPGQRTVFLPTPEGEWTSHRIDFAKEYKNAQWMEQPDRLFFGIVFGAADSASGWRTGYVHGFSATLKPATGQSQENRESALPSAGNPAIPQTRDRKMTLHDLVSSWPHTVRPQ